MTDVLTRPRVDPRIAGRWVEARRQEGRRRLHRFLASGAVLAVAGLAAGSLYSPIFELRHIRLTTSAAFAVSEVASFAGVRLYEPLIDINTSTVVGRLDNTADLGAAAAQVTWPGTLVVSVTQRYPVMVVKRPGVHGPTQWAEVDQTGRVLAYAASPPPSLPRLNGVTTLGPVGSWIPGSPGAKAGPSGPVTLANVDVNASSSNPPSQVAAALAFVSELPSNRRGMVQSINIGGGALTLRVTAAQTPATENPALGAPGAAFANQPQTVAVNLGDGSHLAAKVVALLTVLDQGPRGGISGIDLSVPERPVLSGPAGATQSTSSS